MIRSIPASSYRGAPAVIRVKWGFLPQETKVRGSAKERPVPQPIECHRLDRCPAPAGRGMSLVSLVAGQGRLLHVLQTSPLWPVGLVRDVCLLYGPTPMVWISDPKAWDWNLEFGFWNLRQLLATLIPKVGSFKV